MAHPVSRGNRSPAVLAQVYGALYAQRMSAASRPRNRLILGAVVLIAGLIAPVLAADDWPQFRGPSGNGVSVERDLPLEWGPGKNVRWRVALPHAGNSSPIVSRGRVFITVAEDKGRKRTLVCINRKTGKTLWSRTVRHPDVTPTHKENPYCGSTPCADGERVIAWHSSAGLYCYDFDGKPLWNRKLGKFAHIWGYASSPIIRDNRVFLNCGPGDRTFLVALDKRNGKTLWKQEETGGDSKKWIGSWATPVPVKAGGKEQLLLGFPRHVKAYDPESGRVLWTCKGLSDLVYSDITVGDGIGIATGEDEGGNSIGFRLGGQGDVSGTHLLWARRRKMEVGTGIIVDRHFWSADNSGMLRCTEIETGREVLKERLPGGPAWGSMIYAAGRIYITTRSGDTVVLDPDPKEMKVLAVNNLGEKSNATPAISGGEIFLRTNGAIICISKSP